jgi:anthranilate phosphoribosyltransferase
MLNKLIEKRNLSFEEAYNVFNEILNGSPVRVSAYLTAIQLKGFTAEELAGFAKAMRDRAVKVDFGKVHDTCGTGGDNSNTINVSTASAIVSSCVTRIAKHGNVSVTSKSGSANLLSALGIRYKLRVSEAERLIKKTGFTFLFAPMYHPHLRRIMPVRKELGIKTIFNVLGPLCNPSNPESQIIGVYSKELLEKVAFALMLLNGEGVIVFGNGLDEVNPSKPTLVAEVNKGGIETYKITPEDFGLKESKVIPCKSPEESAKRILGVFKGEGTVEDRNFILVNSAMLLYSANFGDFMECREIAEEILEIRAMKKLEEIKNAVSKA